jgi:hypothetical protein
MLYATERAHVLRKSAMAVRARQMVNVLQVSVSMDSAAKANAMANVSRVPQQKREVARMAFADPLHTTLIQTKNAGAVVVMATGNANITMAFLAQRPTNACPTTARMDIVAATSVRKRVTRARTRRKDTDLMVFVNRSPP